ncbi:type II toxin-antitoxin system prevent-host-death family antitoxin [Rhizobium sp. CG5]|uniref:type II toxin-antitoxin system Phd/YefM family antitoxin n=1 Tax=Rhizobium sp. CG5 TaxID=2726076 RepID=UPI0020341EB4|nr:type II toxin-antitoxin system prevent-host-death family antitoxin [Rhizobium sp. CG5]MCM2474628.1 type II toxin-antitoxin system prevent-host-death family antitoxin [Rhizobium sp. CG5]
MNISVSEAAQKLAELVRRAEAGEEIVLTDAGKAVARLKAEVDPSDAAVVYTEEDRKAEKPVKSPEEKLAAIRKIQADVKAMNLPKGVSAARSQDYLYDESGLPK